MVLLVLGLLVIAIILNVYAKWPTIETPYPTNLGKEKLRFIKYISCSLAMCSGNAKEGDICKSPEVLSVGRIEFEKGKEKTCRELCDELKEKHGMMERYCGKDYAIKFTFKEDVEYIGNYSVDPLKPETYGSCSPLKSGLQTDISCLGNWGDILDPVCIKCEKNCGFFSCDENSFVEGVISTRDTCEIGEDSAVVYIDNNLLGFGVECEDDENLDIWKLENEKGVCRFENNTEILIWSDLSNRMKSFITPFGGCFADPFHTHYCYSVSICKPE